MGSFRKLAGLQIDPALVALVLDAAAELGAQLGAKPVDQHFYRIVPVRLGLVVIQLI